MRAAATLLLAGLAAAEPAAAQTVAVDHGAITAAAITDHIRPGYANAARMTSVLNVMVDRHCANPDTSSLGKTRTAFHDALDAWQAVEHLRFGPAEAASAHARLNFWPDRRGRVGKHLRRLLARPDGAILKPKAFAQGSVAVQGFPALERLLFGDPPLARRTSTTGAVSPCGAAQAMAGNSRAITQGIATAWQADLFAAKPAKAGTGALFNSLAAGLQVLADLKLGGPLGKAAGRPRPKRAEHWRSGRALRNIARNLTALEDLYDTMARAAGPVLSGTDHDTLIRQLFRRAIGDATGLGPSIGAALNRNRGRLRLQVLASDIADLRELVITHMAEALGLVLGFNSFDGD